MAKYHVKENGEPGVCTAEEGNCPRGKEAPHFDSQEKARDFYASENANANVPAATRKKTGINEINALAKTEKDPKKLVEYAEIGSSRINTSIIRNSHADGLALEAAVKSGVTPEVAKEAYRKPDFPVRSIPDSMFIPTTNNINSKARHSSPDLDDTKAQKLLDLRGRGVFSNNLAEIVSNPNKVSPELKKEIFRKDFQAALVGARSGEFTIKDAFDSDDAYNRRSEKQDPNYTTPGDKEIYVWKNRFAQSTSPESLSQTTDWVLNHPGKPSFATDGVALDLASNPNISSEDLLKLTKYEGQFVDEFKQNFARNVFANPAADSQVKKAVKSNLSDTDKTIMKASSQYKDGRKGLQQALLAGVSENTSIGRAITKTKVPLNKDKISELGLSKEAIISLYRPSFNAEMSYDEETGILTGVTDSSD